MIETIKLFIDAKASLQPNLIDLIKDISKNSLSEVLHTDVSDNILFVTIQTTADKLEHLGYKLSASGIQMAESATAILKNAAGQYSLYRDIHLNMNVEGIG